MDKFYFIRLNPFEEYLYTRMAKSKNMGIIEFLHLIMAEGADFVTEFDDLDYLQDDPIWQQYIEQYYNES